MRPGTPDAKQAGCVCPVIDNCHGKGLGGDGERFGWVVVFGCPLHGRDSAARDRTGRGRRMTIKCKAHNAYLCNLCDPIFEHPPMTDETQQGEGRKVKRYDIAMETTSEGARAWMIETPDAGYWARYDDLAEAREEIERLRETERRLVVAMRDALADLVMWSDQHPDYPERAVVKTKYVERGDEALRAFNAAREGVSDVS